MAAPRRCKNRLQISCLSIAWKIRNRNILGEHCVEHPHCSSLEGDSAQPLTSACGRSLPKSNGSSASPQCGLSGNRVVSVPESDVLEMGKSIFLVVLSEQEVKKGMRVTIAAWTCSLRLRRRLAVGSSLLPILQRGKQRGTQHASTVQDKVFYHAFRLFASRSQARCG
jgi:hypothetical protein